MAATPEHVERYMDAHAACAAELPGRGVTWLDSARSRSLERFLASGFPTPRMEAWRYTDIGPIARRSLDANPGSLGDDEQAAVRDAVSRLGEGLDAAATVVLVNGVALDGAGAAVPGLASVADVLRESPEQLRASLEAQSEDGFCALNRAFLRDGCLLDLPAGTELDRPLHIVHVSIGEVDRIAHAGHWLRLGAGSRAQVVESYITLGGATHLVTAATEVELACDASLEHVRMQYPSERGHHVGTVAVDAAAGSRYASFAFGLGGRLGRCELSVKLREPGASCALNGLYLLDGRAHNDFYTRVEHAAPDTRSDQLFKGVLDGHARGVFQGRVIVQQDAQRTEAMQRNHNLLLSRNAEADTKPQLEIYADDVRCSHGATVGQLDPDQLFYLRSRGLSPEAARASLTYGFADEVITGMPLAGARARVRAQLAEALPDAIQNAGADPEDDR